MAVNTQNIDLVKPGTEEFYDVNIMNSNLDKIDSYTGEIKNKLENGFIQEKALQLGYNRIQIPEIPVSPKIEFTGYSYTNLLGRDGHSNISKWNQNQFIVATIDTTYTQIGQNSIKLTLSNPWATFARRMHSVSFGNTKYYMFSAYIRNGNAANIGIYKDDTGGGVPIQSNVISDTTKFTRVVFKTAPGEIVGDDWFAVQVSGSAGQYAYVDGIMLNEIPANDYSLSDTELMAKYPYVDSYACLTNPYFENRRYNLVRNGNCEDGIGYWCAGDSAAGKLTVENGKFKIVPAGAYGYFYQEVPVKANINYYISCNVSTGGGMSVYNADRTMQIRGGSGTFSVSTDTKVVILIGIGTVLQPIYFDSIMLIEGTTAPSEYKSCDLQRFVVEGQYTQDDKIVIENGKVSGLINWKHTTLFGKDFDWRFMGDHPGCKCVGIPIEAFPEAYTSGPIGNRLVKPNGEMANEGPVGGGIVNNFNLTTTAGGLVFNISDNDTGWDENINPGIDEVKAFMNGWKAAWNDGTRYTLWRTVGTPASTGLADYPAGTATTLTAASDGSASITVEDASVFKVGDGIAVIGIVPTIVSGINGNVITTVDTIASGGEIGNIVARLDTPATDSRILNYCKNNIAPGYEGYKLHYKLASPKPVTDIDTVIKGEIWDLVKGDNYVTIDSGIELGEVANYVITGGYVYMNEDYPTIYSPFRNKVENSDVIIYKNGLPDIHKWTPETSHGYGNYRFYTTVNNFDVNATYTADYQILKTLHAQGFGSLVISYPQSIISALEGHSKALEHKQTKNSTLDTIIDLSMYEEIGFEMTGRILQSSAYNGYVYYDIRSIIQKKCVPQFTIKNPTAVALNGSSGVLSIPPIDYMLFFAGGLQNQTRYLKLKFIYTGSDSIIKSCIANYGFIVTCTVIADCRGRV